MSRQKRSLLVSFLIGFLILVGLDQWTKGLAVRFLKNQEPVAVIKGVFEFSYLENRGAAFGMLQNRQFFFFLIGIAVLAAILYMMWRMPETPKYRPLAVCLMLVAAGAVGNMIDRTTQNYVVDFLYFRLIDFPVFNVADCYVTIAAAGLVLLVLFYYDDEDLDCFQPGKAHGKEKTQ